MPAVANCKSVCMGPTPKTARPIWEMTVSACVGYGSRWRARIETPRNSDPRMNAIVVSVVAAFFDSGLRNAGIPFEIASTPESATAPDEKPRRMRNSESDPPVWRMCSARSASNGTGLMSPKNTRNRP